MKRREGEEERYRRGGSGERKLLPSYCHNQ